MKKLLLLCFLLFTIIPFNSTHAASLNCTLMNSEINNYPTYKVKIDSLFSKILEENTTVQEGYYKKLSTLTSKYLKQVDPITQKNIYTLLWYINCENDSRLLQNNGSYLLEDALDW